MSSKDLLLDQFVTCYEENGWFVALKNAVSGLSAEQAAWKPEGADNSINEILNHLNYYNNAYLQRFKGLPYEYTVADNDATFDEGAAENWDLNVERLDSILTEWRDLLETVDERKLEELAPPRNESKWQTVIANINTHNAHHGGQIVLLRKHSRFVGSRPRGKLIQPSYFVS